MRILKWQQGLKFEEDPPIVPIWVLFHELPLEWTHPKVLFSIASAVGKPLQLDTPTLNLTRPSVARLCVEVDLTKESTKSIHIGKKGKNYEQHYTYEYVPSYHPACCKIAHKESDCRKGKGVSLNVLKADALKKAEHADKEVNLAGNKKGIRLQQQKVTWGSKKMGKKTKLQVDIIKENPLIVNGVELQVVESWAAKTLVSRPMKTLEARVWGSTSYLSVKEKCVFPVTLWIVPLLILGVMWKIMSTLILRLELLIIREWRLTRKGNLALPPVSQVVILQEFDDDCDAVKSSDNVDDDDVENVFTEEHNESQLVLVDKCIKVNNLMEVSPVGDGFTWGGTRATGWVIKKLDHILFSPEWMDMFPRVSIEHLSRTTLDHSPLLLQIDAQLETRLRCFRHYGLLYKLRHLKLVLKESNKTQFGDVFQNLKMTEDRVKELEIVYDHSGHANDRLNLNLATSTLLQKLKEHDDFWKKKMQLTWFKERDNNTAYFRASLAERKLRMGIQKIQTEDGCV
ncbi:OLC1v1036016C1 [Oldenlandia corymbosa var. corymbosa]|uniref:OLC1v1036016C1 n=1 Tax=Oldenlandia corymbosa var. corymbosa TaxID=529605 RepID=A0AAV1CVF9_OLDCO|nr:OLC1v1036016C1 [Oldenlandia corymbosa var. corymbosa]